MIHATRSLCVLTFAALAACSSAPVPPLWQANAHSALESYSGAYLRGESGPAEADFARARNEIASTGRPELAARAELLRCATRVASLEFGECPGFAAFRQDASAGERAYALYLTGQNPGADASLLPPQHRAMLLAAPSGDAKSALEAIADPLSRLVAAGVLLQNGRLRPVDIALALDTASAQGWRRPLLAWLGVAATRARAAGDADALARIERRIALAAPTQTTNSQP